MPLDEDAIKLPYKTKYERDIEAQMMDLADRFAEHPDIRVDPRAWNHLLVYWPERKSWKHAARMRTSMLCVGGPCHGKLWRPLAHDIRLYDIAMLNSKSRFYDVSDRWCMMIPERHIYSVDHETGVLRFIRTEAAQGFNT